MKSLASLEDETKLRIKSTTPKGSLLREFQATEEGITLVGTL
jgi:hypothetical protein